MANHGAVIVGTSLEDAMYNSDRLERECEIYFRSLQLGQVGRPINLTGEEMVALATRDLTYGQSPAGEEPSE